MSQFEFIRNLQAARNLVSPWIESQSPVPPSADRAETYRRVTFWLTPRTVKGFRAKDFASLGEERQRELTEAVRAFLEVAKKVPGIEEPTPEQVETALPHFLKILQPFQPSLTEPDESRVIDLLRNVPLPEGLAGIRYEFGYLSEDEPLVRVFAIIDFEPLEDWERARLIRDRIDDAILTSGLARTGYALFRGVEEERSLNAGVLK